MSKKINNKILLIAVGVLVILYAGVKMYSKFVTDKTISSQIIEVDTTKVTKIQIYPTSEQRAEITFVKSGSSWTVSKDKITAQAEPNGIKQLLSQIMEIKSQRLAAKSKDKWAEFNVTDTAATRFKVYEGSDLVADVYIGKFTYQQSQNPYAMYGGGNGGVTGTTYVRLNNNDEIYAVNGFLIFTFNQQFASWRNQTLVRFDKANLNKITCKYSLGDSSFTATLAGKNWLVNGTVADSAKMATWLGSLTYKNASQFNDTYVASGMPYCTLTLEGNNMPAITVNAYQYANNTFVLNSSLNNKSMFSSIGNTLMSELFKKPTDFFDTTKK
jgi:hypothetical protein